MGKHIDELGSFQDFRAPWETETGDEAEVDKPKLKKLLFNARSAKAAALDERDEAQEALTAAEADLEEAKKQAASANGEEAQKTIDKLQKKVDDLTTERDRLVESNEQRELREKVLGDFAAEHPKAAKYVTGTTEEELEASLAAVKEDFGITDGDGDDDGDDGDDLDEVARTQPRSRVTLRNPGDRESGKGSDAIDFDAVADDILGTSVFR